MTAQTAGRQVKAGIVDRDTMSRFHMCLIILRKLPSSTCSIPYSVLGEHAGYAPCNWCGASPTMYRIGFKWRQENPSGNSIRLRARAGQYGEIKRMVEDAPSDGPPPYGS